MAVGGSRGQQDERAGKRGRRDQAYAPNQGHHRHNAAEAGRVALRLECGDLVGRFAGKAGAGNLIDQGAAKGGTKPMNIGSRDSGRSAPTDT